MKFTLKTTGNRYADRIRIQKVEKLQKFGFTFDKKFYKLSDGEIEINTLEELIEFSREWGELVISEGCIEIYDDYRE